MAGKTIKEKVITEKIYYEDAYQAEFEAEVLRQEERDGRRLAVLDRTAFYPGGGGQPCDLGTLGGREVLEVFESGGEILHAVDGPLPQGRVRGAIDWARRFDLMQQHLGQHVLSAVFFRRCSLSTVSMHMERDAVSIDLDAPADEEVIRQAEAAANEAVWQDIPVEALYPNIEDIRRHTRKMPPSTPEPIRIIRIGELDYIPCCGLHVRSTGAAGPIKVTSSEKHKGGTRLHLKCGRPAFRWLSALYRDAKVLQQELTCGEGELVERIRRQKDQAQELKAEVQDLRQRLSAATADALLDRAEPAGGFRLVVHALPDATQEDLKRLFQALTERRGVVALLGGRSAEGAFLIFGCGREEGVDVRGAFEQSIAMIGGKGGGPSFCAQGFGRDAAQLDAALEAAREIMRRTLA